MGLDKMRKIAIVGAGKTGRGFIGRLLKQAGREMLFVDNNKEQVDALNAAGSFRVDFFGGRAPGVTVDGYAAYTWADADLSGVGLIFVSVGGGNLADVGRALARRAIAPQIILCENARSPVETLTNAAGRQIAAAEATVFCTTIEGGGLDIASENYPVLQFDARPFGGNPPRVNGFTPVSDFGNFLTRKLFTYNAASCVIAYLGCLLGYTAYSDAANDTRIIALLDKNYEQTNRALCAEFGYDAAEQAEFARLSRVKFLDTAIADTIARNAREPQRKLSAGERIIGPMTLIQKHGGDSAALEGAAAAALLYDGEDEWREIKARLGFAGILREIGGLPPDGKLFKNIMDYVECEQSGNSIVERLVGVQNRERRV
jgi:mannitol-1-phosphate 5-dehydrogenase